LNISTVLSSIKPELIGFFAGGHDLIKYAAHTKHIQ